MNKKGVTFEVTFIIAAIGIMVFAFYMAFIGLQERTAELSPPLRFVNVQNEAREARFYIQESAKFSVQHASFSILKNFPVEGNCESLTLDQAVVWIWGSGCGPDIEGGESKFVEVFDVKFSSYLDEYESTFKNVPGTVVPPATGYSAVITKQNKDNYDFSLTDEDLTGTARERLIYVSSPAKILVDPSFSVDIPFPLSDLDKMYAQSIKAVDECDKEDLAKCVEDKIVLDNFDVQVRQDGSLLIFTTQTKQRLFFEDGEMKFEKISFEYAFSLS